MIKLTKSNKEKTFGNTLFESIAVGMGLHSMPMAEMIGSATESEHLPKPERSFITAILFIIFTSQNKYKKTDTS